jgi:hypothetical protein
MTTNIALSIILAAITVWCGLKSFRCDGDGTIVHNRHTTGIWLICAVQYIYVLLSEGMWPITYPFSIAGGSLLLFVAVAWVKTYSLFPSQKKEGSPPQPDTPPPIMPDRRWFQQ